MASSNKKVQFIIEAKDQFSGVLGKAGKGFSNLGKVSTGTFKEMAGAGKVLASGIAVATAAIGALGYKAAKSTSEMEQARIAFETMLGSAEKAGELLAKISKFAEKTPFELPELVEGSKRLLAYGNSAEEIIPLMTDLGNIAAGVGKDKLPFLITALGQVRAKTVLSGEELKQFTETGVPLIEELAVVTGHSVTEIADKTKDLGITYDQVREAVKNLGGEGGRFNNLMEKQASTLGGVISNLFDILGRFGRSAMGMDEQGNIKEGSIFARIKSVAETLLDFLDSNKDRISNFFNEALVAFDTFIAKLGELWNMVQPYLQPMIDKLKEFFSEPGNRKDALIGVLTALGTFLVAWAVSAVASFAPIILIFAGIVAAVMLVRKAWQENWGGIQEKTAAVLEWLKMAYNEYLIPFLQMAQEWLISLYLSFQEKWESIKSVLLIFWNWLRGWWNIISGIFSGDWEKFWFGVGQVAGALWEGIKKILSLAWEGIKKLFLVFVEWILKKWEEYKKNSEEKGKAISEAFISFFTDPIDTIKAAWEKFSSWISDKLSKISSAIKKVKEGFSSSSKGHKAMGGSVEGGRGYVVGERGPELFMPGQSGTIIPNHKLQGDSGKQMVFNFNFQGAMVGDKQQLINEIKYAINRETELSAKGIG